jgi:hypothetical protein
MVMVAVIALIMVVAAIVRSPRPFRSVVALALVVVAGLGLFSLTRNNQVRNVALDDIFAARILTVPSRTTWFINHGMPVDPTVASSAGSYPPTGLEDDPAFSKWMDTKGFHTYLMFVLEHPGYSLLGPLPYLSGEQSSIFEQPPSGTAGVLQPNPVASMLSPTVNYGRHREVLPQPIEELLFEQGQIGDLIVLALFAVGVNVIAWRRFGRDRRLLVPVWTVVLVFVHHYFLWLTTGPPELDRLAIAQAVAIRIGLWIALACGVDRLAAGGRRVRGRHARATPEEAGAAPE